MEKKWVAVIDGECFGFFASKQDAIFFVENEFPVSFAINVWKVYEFNHV